MLHPAVFAFSKQIESEVETQLDSTSSNNNWQKAAPTYTKEIRLILDDRGPIILRTSQSGTETLYPQFTEAAWESEITICRGLLTMTWN